jgi:hypothetical protein
LFDPNFTTLNIPLPYPPQSFIIKELSNSILFFDAPSISIDLLDNQKVFAYNPLCGV